MKNLLIAAIAALSLTAFAAPAAAQTAVRVGTDISNLNNGADFAGSIDVSGVDLFNGVTAGVEARSEFDRGVTELTARAGPAFSVGRLTISPTVQLGLANIANDGRGVFGTFGGGVNARFALTSRLTAIGSATYRQAFDGRDRYRVAEYTAGGEYKLTDKFAVDARYFNRDGTLDSSGVGLGATFRF